MGKKCQACGATNPDIAKDCMVCGKRLGRQSPLEQMFAGPSKGNVPGSGLLPDPLRIIWTDYGCFLVLIIGLVGAFFTSGLALFAAVPLLAWRTWAIYSRLLRGTVVKGRIENTSFYRDRGRVQYSYTYQGQPYHGGNAIHKTNQTKALMRGTEVDVVVDPDNPQRALIRDLYVKPGDQSRCQPT